MSARIEGEHLSEGTPVWELFAAAAELLESTITYVDFFATKKEFQIMQHNRNSNKLKPVRFSS